jgi:DNA-binding NarL/FixJ family response regulator
MHGELSVALSSDREAEVLRLIARGFSSKEITVQPKKPASTTIEPQKAAPLCKPDISRRNEIVGYAILRGWLQEN